MFITNDSSKLSIYEENLRFFLKQNHNDVKVLSFPDMEIMPYEEASVFKDIAQKRMRTLFELLTDNSPVILITTVRALMDKVLSPETYKNAVLDLSKGEGIDIPDLQKRLVRMGYIREEFVEDVGSFSVRGEVVDIYSPLYDHPVRFDFFDNTIETMRQFAVHDQRSFTQLEKVSILPVREFVFPEKGLSGDVPDERLKESLFFDGIENFREFINPGQVSFNTYLKNHDISVIYDDLSSLHNKAGMLEKEYLFLYEKNKDQFNAVPPDLLFSPFESIRNNLHSRRSVDFAPFKSSDQDLDLQPVAHHKFSGDVEKLREQLSEYHNKGFDLTVSSNNEGTLARLKDIINDKGFEKTSASTSVHFTLSPLDEGFILGKPGVFFVTDVDIYNKRRTSSARRSHASQDIFSFIELKPDDFVVHVNYGIGIFRAIINMEVEGKLRDFVLIEYRDADKLYVPLDQINLIQKYIGQEGHAPELSKLGSYSWDTVKGRIKESIQKYAKELLELYTLRAKIQGYAFKKHTEWEKQFELSFKYTETPDQTATIEAVLQDMEKPIPMDRLLCGDVGYGKTEVAMRAAFRAVMDGKQVAVLVPTTILAEQHYTTFTQRFEAFPVTIEVMSRFRKKSDLDLVAAKVNKGEVDIVIGTHKILHNCQFKDLGLLVIDEEQKFGVKHKEKLKGVKKNVDVLSMSATPIPRTFNMSLAGIRDISVIETPPQDRLPISTFIVPFNDGTIVEGIQRELDRHGQVFFIHNEIRTIDRVAAHLKALMPKVKFEVTHSKLDDDVLEEIMMEFYEKKFDVLVSTTIVESGLDIPNVNTIFINDAHEFGLAQLYQLKGRVGRSDQRAFAYLLYPREKDLSDISKKRLATINEFTELGSGIKVAMKDLEIRGAGNIFGTQQHGNILSVGLDMYLKILESTMRELKGERVLEDAEPNLNINYEGYIPDKYIPTLKSKIHFYKEIMKCKELEELGLIESELEDRFGRIPEEVRQIFTIKRSKILARKVGIAQVSETQDEIVLKFSHLNVPDENTVKGLLEFIASNPGVARIQPQYPDSIWLKKEKGAGDNPVKKIHYFLSNLVNYVNPR